MLALQNCLMRLMNDRVAKHKVVLEDDFALAYGLVGEDSRLALWIVNLCTHVLAVGRLDVEELATEGAAVLLTKILRTTVASTGLERFSRLLVSMLQVRFTRRFEFIDEYLVELESEDEWGGGGDEGSE